MTSFLDKHRCPITHEIMTDPVLAPDTHNYERDAIVRYLRTNPISPMTRQPMRVEQLIPNRELRQEIEQLLTTADTIEPDQMMQDDSAVCEGEIRTYKNGAGFQRQQVCIAISDGEAGPLSIAFVKDISGSMNREVATAEGESDGYNMLDIASHGTNVCIKSLRPCDRAALVSFNSSAKKVTELQKMTPGNKGLLQVKLAGLSPSGSTNLWDGIKTALEMLPDDGIVCILTDGEPTVRPPKGELRMFNEWRDAHPNWRGQVHTFGFGYSLDSQLLVDIARAGNGRYSFIPDSSLVGTVFVHFMANIRTTYASECLLSVETDGVITGIGPHTKTSWGYQIPIGPLMFGQRRDYYLQGDRSAMTCTIEGIDLRESEEEGNCTWTYKTQRQRTALAIYDSLRVRPNLEQFASTVRCPKLLADITGQWTEAMKIDHFNRWGRHYLPSLAGAHLTQTCNNFLDKGIQTYGGARFHQLRDAFDKIFNEMPAPRATLRQQVEQRAYSRGVAMRAAPTTMASYNDRGGPCFPGFCQVKDLSHKEHTLASVKRGDKILAPGGYATVQYVLKTMCPRGFAKVVHIQGLYATPFHPIKPHHEWIFPSTIGDAEDIPCEAIYSLVLDKPSCYIEGIECIGLAHGIENDPVATHAFFGTEKVKQMLEILDENESGLVVLPGPEAIQRGSDGLVCGFVV